MKKNMKIIHKAFVAVGICFVMASFALAQTVVTLRDNIPLRTDNGKGGVEWATEVLAGLKLELLSPETVKMDLVTSTETTPDVEFYQVRYQGKNYFVRASEAMPATNAAVVTTDAVLFTRPRLSDFRNAILEAGSIVVAGNQVSHGGIDFVEVHFFDTSAWQIRSRYLVSSMVSSASSDVEAVQLLQKANTMKDKGVQQELIHNAMNLNTSAGIQQLVQEAAEQFMPVTFTQDDIEPLAMTLGAVATGDGENVNVRSFPGTGEQSQVVGQLSHGTEVQIYGHTLKTQTIDGVETPWYQVTAYNDDGTTVAGWVLGRYLQTGLRGAIN